MSDHYALRADCFWTPSAVHRYAAQHGFKRYEVRFRLGRGWCLYTPVIGIAGALGRRLGSR